MFNKINVSGPGAHPLWRYLNHQTFIDKTKGIKTYFAKFFIDMISEFDSAYPASYNMFRLEEKIREILCFDDLTPEVVKFEEEEIEEEK